MEITFIQTEDTVYRPQPQSVQGECHDCGNWDDSLTPYRYEPCYLLCEGCTDDRMED